MNRRDALRATGAGFVHAAATTQLRSATLPDTRLFETDPERYWTRIRKEQFLLPDWRIFLNNGSLGVAPRPVVETVRSYAENAAGLLSDEYPRWGYETLDEHRTEMAGFIGCHKDELAFTHNATEAMSIIADGLDLKSGDEVLITNQEHPSGRGPWLKQQARHGISVRELPLSLPPKSTGEIAERLISGIGPRTRVISFSGITTTTGLIMPVREICEAARARGVISVVDGAHMIGQVPVNLSSLGCDLFAGSPHKWLFTPPGCGVLYIRREMLDRLWPGTVTGNWNDKTLHAARFMMVGTNNRSVFEGMVAGLRFHKSIGSDRIFTRIHALSQRVRKEAESRPYLRLLTPADDNLYAALVAFEIQTSNMKPFLELCRRKRIWISGSNQRLRISTHIHTRQSDLDALFEALNQSFLT